MGGGREQVFQTQLEVRCADGYGVLPVLGRFLPSHQSPEKGLINPFIAQKHHPETPTQLLHTAAKNEAISSGSNIWAPVTMSPGPPHLMPASYTMSIGHCTVTLQ